MLSDMSCSTFLFYGMHLRVTDLVSALQFTSNLEAIDTLYERVLRPALPTELCDLIKEYMVVNTRHTCFHDQRHQYYLTPEREVIRFRAGLRRQDRHLTHKLNALTVLHT